jgi:ribosomal-protein-alanine N-acetyltransferase
MIIYTRRFKLKDFCESDREAFVRYQMDPRYRRLYGSDRQSEQKALDLFDLFLTWQSEKPRTNFQFGIFEQLSGRLCGSAGLRRKEGAENRPFMLGIELNPDDWGRYRVSIEILSALIDHGFGVLGANTIIGTTASGNMRVARLARWFGAEVIAERTGGPDWMIAKGWHEMDWGLSRANWNEVKRKTPNLRSSAQFVSYEARRDRERGRAGR